MDHHPIPSLQTIIWTRRAEHREADSATLRGLRGTIIYCPALHITDAAPAAGPVPPGTLIVTSAEAAKRLVALEPSVPAAPWQVLTFSPLVAKALEGDTRFAVTVFAEATTGEELAACILKAPDTYLPSGEPCFFAGAAEPAFDFARHLTAQGCPCQHWPLYRTSIISTPNPDLAEVAALDGKRKPAIAVFCSPSAVRGFAAQWQSLTSALPRFGPDSSWLALAIGKTTATAAAPYFDRIEIAAKPRLASIAARLHQLAGSSPPVTM